MTLKSLKIAGFTIICLMFFGLSTPYSIAYASGGAEKSEKDDLEKAKEMSKFVRLDPIIIPVIQENGLQQVISMVVVIEAKEEGQVEKINEMKPKLADAFLSDMYGTFSRPANMNSGLVKISELKTRMVKLATEILGEDVVADVLLQVLQQRPA